MFGMSGAFTGKPASPGLAEAHGETIFLTRSGPRPETGPASCARLNTDVPPGADRDSRVDVRVVSATSASSRGCSAALREDLTRLNGFEIHLTPLGTARTTSPSWRGT